MSCFRHPGEIQMLNLTQRRGAQRKCKSKIAEILFVKGAHIVLDQMDVDFVFLRVPARLDCLRL